MQLKNKCFIIETDDKSGYFRRITASNDAYEMNFVLDGKEFGRINGKSKHYPQPFAPLTVNAVADDGSLTSVYSNGRCEVTLRSVFTERDTFRMTYVFKNVTAVPLTLCRDTVGIDVPFNDRYTHAEECLTRRSHTHVHCGLNSSWVNAMRMGPSDVNLGLALTEGSLVSYSQYECKTNERGYFELEPETVILSKGESYTLAWELFIHSGWEDFFHRLHTYDAQVRISAEHYTVFLGETLRFTALARSDVSISVTLDGKKVPTRKTENGYLVEYRPKRIGELKFTVKCGKNRAFAEFSVKTPFEKLTKKRVRSFVKKQQYNDARSPLDGAFLVYDNKLDAPYFDYCFTDHNACRERLNMAFTLIKYLQYAPSTSLQASLDRFIKFMFREFYDEESGDVFNNIGKDHDFLRLYNAPGVMLLFAEAYTLTRDEKYLDNILRLADKYYSIGGEKCYSNAVAIKKVMGAFALSDRKKDSEKILAYFKKHVDNMINNGLAYPKHEVNYEQTIVTAAVICISEFGRFTENKDYYIAEARKHLACLERFSGRQPTFHKNEIAVRFWDDYWFGGKGRFGDTLPHHLSCLTARAYIAFYELSGETEWLSRAEECIRNCLCLVGDDGTGSAAYVLPHKVNGEDGEFFDHWANDQDLVLYDGMYLGEYVQAFRINKGNIAPRD